MSQPRLRTLFQNVSRRTIIRIALIMIAAVSVLATVAVRQVLDDSARTAAHHRQLERLLTDRSRIRAVLSDLRRAALAHRGYLATDDAAFLRSYREAVADLPAEVRMLRDSLAENVEGASAERLAERIDRLLVRLERGLHIDGSSGRGSVDATRNGAIEARLDALRAIAERTVAATDEAIATRTSSFRRQKAASRAITLGALAAILGVIAVCAATAIAYLEHRLRFEAELRAAKHQAEDAQSEAEQASEAKTEFLAVMSHEIRTPLTGILGYTELLLDQDLGEKQRHYAERIETAGARLLAIANDILEFSRIEAGEITIAPTPFRVRSFVDNVVSIVSESARQKSLPIRTVISSNLPETVSGDELRIQQILLNLLDNAIKFTEKGEIVLAVEPDGSAEAVDLVRFTVRDTGIGIPPDKRNLLFQRFSQVDASNRREHGGAGLGLAIARRLTELMGGEIGVESEPGVGSTFRVRLPLPRCAAVPGDDRDSAGRAGARSGQILLVEDLDQNRELVQAILESAGHVVDPVASGAEAISAVQARRHDLVLMDIQMPGMDGIAATAEIRSLDHPARDLPILAMTASALPQQIRAFRDAGMNDHVAKPFQRAEIIAKVDRWLETTVSQDAAAVSPDMPDGEGTAPDTSDGEVTDDLETLLGREWVAAGARRLEEQLAAVFDHRDPHSAAPADLARQAHDLVSQAGMLGYGELSRRCSELEEACLRGTDIPEVFARAAEASARARAQLAGTRHPGDA